MRSALLSGLGLAVGMFGSSAFGQDNRPPYQPVRAARLGAPIAAPDNSPNPQNITTVGLLSPVQDGSQIPTPMPLPGSGQTAPPASGTMVPGGMGTIVPGNIPLSSGTPIPAPRPIPPTPSVTEMRGPEEGMGFPTYPQGFPSTNGMPTVVPSIVPGMGYPTGGIEGSPSGDCPTGAAPVDRVNSCGRWFASAEYLMWWTRSMQVPSLLTTSSPAFNGILGTGNTTTLYGGDVGNTFHAGGRFSVGRWFCDDPLWGAEGRFFFLGDSQSTFTANSSQYPVLARPFYNVNDPMGQFSELVSYPGLANGSVLIKTQTSLWGAEANARRVLYGKVDGGGLEVDAIVGYRYMNLNEKLSIEEEFERTPNSNMRDGTPAINGNVTDLFHTTNVFNGGQIGVSSSYQYGKWSVDGRATVAFGDLEQTAAINGGQTLYFANGTVGKYVGGLLALPNANIGTFRHSQFAVLPEVSLNLGYQVTSHVRLFIGYDFLFLGNALRPGGAVDTTIDAARIPNFPLAGSPAPLAGSTRPGPYFHNTDFFAQGINFGMQFKW